MRCGALADLPIVPTAQSGWGAVLGHCGAGLGEAPAARPTDSEGELKQITVLFADVSGSTELIEGLDPEAAAKRLAPAIEAMKEAVRRFEGSVVRVAGDGIMAVFGTPTPQEDHAVRACCAGLALQAAVKALPGEPLRRAGRHPLAAKSWRAPSRPISRTTSTRPASPSTWPTGWKPWRRLAPSRSRRRRCGGAPVRLRRVAGRARDPRPATPLEVFLLTGLRRGPTSLRFTSERDGPLSSAASRDGSCSSGRWSAPPAATACVIGLVAEAGVGKSRLCFEFAERCRAKGVPVLEGAGPGAQPRHAFHAYR